MAHDTTRRLRALTLLSLTWLASCGGGAHEIEDDVTSSGTGGESAPTLAEHALAAVSSEPAAAERSIAALRSAGPAGHRALFQAHAEEIAALRDAPRTATTVEIERLRHAIDVVSAQRDGHASGLYWHTDLASAQREARETGRPILSLRLLGRLDEEMSCANSRYFRLVLYPNREVSSFLREHFVLHWSSERPVPRITIDMGDGRRLERTITGNSIHYVLDWNGRVLDALPGLYGPREMLRFLTQVQEAHAAFTGARPTGAGATGEAALAAYQTLALGTLRESARLAATAFPSLGGPAAPGSTVGLPSAIDAMPLTVSKAFVEAPMLDALRAPGAAPVARADVDWTRIGIEAYQRDLSSIFDERSRALLRLKTGRDEAASAELIASLSASVVGDSARNDATFRLTVLEWLIAARDTGTPLPTLETMNERVYRELFLTPASDPWLGLQDPSVWDAIERFH